MSIFPTRILLATDGSEEAELAAPRAVDIAEKTDSELHVVHVGVVPSFLVSYPGTLGYERRLYEQIEEDSRQRLRELSWRVKLAGGTVAGTHLRMGQVALEIVALAEELGVGLIVMGSRGLGGISAGSHVASIIARMVGHNDRAFLRTARYTTLITMILSPILLIMDLGRPERFYNMLRIVEWRSPMSMGTWALTSFGPLSGLVATSQAAEDGLLGRDNPLASLAGALPARFISVLALPFGFFVGAYTGGLLGATSIPMWARNVVLMGPTFLSSALSTGLSAISFVLHLGGWGERRTLEALRCAERAAIVIETGFIAASLIRMGRWGKPLFSKKLAPLFLGGTILGGILAPLALLSGRASRVRGLLASGLVLLGGLAFRFAMIEGGRLSARDPQATFSFAKKENLLAIADEVEEEEEVFGEGQ